LKKHCSTEKRPSFHEIYPWRQHRQRLLSERKCWTVGGPCVSAPRINLLFTM